IATGLPDTTARNLSIVRRRLLQAAAAASEALEPTEGLRRERIGRGRAVSFGRLGGLEQAEGNAAAPPAFYRPSPAVPGRLAQAALVVSHSLLWHLGLQEGLADEPARHRPALHQQLRTIRSRHMPLDPPLANLLRDLDSQSGDEGTVGTS